MTRACLCDARGAFRGDAAISRGVDKRRLIRRHHASMRRTDFARRLLWPESTRVLYRAIRRRAAARLG